MTLDDAMGPVTGCVTRAVDRGLLTNASRPKVCPTVANATTRRAESMPAYYNSVTPPGRWSSLRGRVQTMRAARLLRQHGAYLGHDFASDGMPQVHLADLRRSPVRIGDFRGRIILRDGCHLNSAGISPFAAGPVRLTVVRWGDAAHECGIIDVASPLNGTAIVSYVGVTIGSDVTLAPLVTIMDCDGHSMDRARPDTIDNMARAPIRIDDGAWIGLGATVLKGVTIGRQAVVAAHALVVRDVRPRTVVGGVPARELRALDEAPDLAIVSSAHQVGGGNPRPGRANR